MAQPAPAPNPWLVAGVLALAYAALVLLGLRWAAMYGHASPVWPAAGLALAALLRWGSRLGPAVFMGSLLALWLSGLPYPWWMKLGFATGSTLAAVAAATTLMRLGFRSTLAGSRDVLLLAGVGAAGGGAVAAGIGTALLWFGGAMHGADAAATWLTWCIGDAAGVLTAAPLLLAWSRRAPAQPLRQQLHVLLSLAATALVGWAVFLSGGLPHLSFAWYAFLPLIWSAMAGLVRGAAASIALMALLALAGTAAAGSDEWSVLHLQQFIVVASLTTLLLAATAAERRGKAVLEAAEARLRLQRERLPVGCIVNAPDYTILEWNPACERIFGYTAEEAVGRSPFDLIIPPEAHAAVQDVHARLLSGSPAEHLVNENVTRDGRRILCEWHNTPLTDAQGRVTGYLATAQDVTGRERDAQRRRLLLEVARTVLEAPEGEAALSRLVFERVGPALDTDILLHYRLAEDGDLHLIEAAGLPPQAIAAAQRLEPGGSFCASVAASGEPLSGDQALIDAQPPQHLVRRLGVRSFVCHPLLTRDGQVMGTLSMGSSTRPSFDAADVAFLQTLSHFVALASERSRAEQALRQSERRFRSIFDTSFQFTGLLSPDGTMLEINRTALDAVGTTREAELGRPFWNITGWQDFAEERERVRRACDQVAAGGFVRFEARYRRHDGSQGIVDLSMSPVRNERGEVVMLVPEGRDITDLKQAQDALKAADRQKDEFLATLAHELRNPLAPIRNGLEILRRDVSVQGTSARARAMMERQLAHLVRLVDDLLDVSRISRGKVELRREPLQLQTVLDHALETCCSLVEEQGHVLALEVPPRPVWIDGDLTRLAQVVSNLLGNAVKYTPRGGRIELRASVGLGADGPVAVVRVIDNGAGIAPDMLPRVFELFAQVDDMRHRAQGGLGIGLSLARRLVELHGGTLTGESAGLGQGSTFTIRLPLGQYRSASQA